MKLNKCLNTKCGKEFVNTRKKRFCCMKCAYEVKIEISPNNTKRCIGCDRQRNIEEFEISRDSKTGLRARCKSCSPLKIARPKEMPHMDFSNAIYRK